MSTEADAQARPASRAAAAVRDLHPGYFGFVMATGIISTGTFLLGPSWLSNALLAAACAGLTVLGAALVMRLGFFRASMAADIRAPDRVLGFFTITAGPTRQRPHPGRQQPPLTLQRPTIRPRGWNCRDCCDDHRDRRQPGRERVPSRPAIR